MPNLSRSVKIVVFCFITMVMAACSDSDDTIEEGIAGNWRWYESSGGIDGRVETPESTGESRSVLFKPNGEVIFYTNNNVSLSSTYSLGKDITIFSEDPLPVVIVEDYFTYAYSFPYVGILELAEDVYDGFTHRYERVT